MKALELIKEHKDLDTQTEKQLIGFRASNDNGETWFDWVWNDFWEAWVVDEPDSLGFSTEGMLNNVGKYDKCEPIYL